MQKLEEKALKKNWKNLTARLAPNPGISCTLAKRANSRLARRSQKARLARKPAQSAKST